MSASCSDALAPVMRVPASRVGSARVGRDSGGARQPRRGSTESAAPTPRSISRSMFPRVKLRLVNPSTSGRTSRSPAPERIGVLLEEELHQTVGDE